MPLPDREALTDKLNAVDLQKCAAVSDRSALPCLIRNTLLVHQYSVPYSRLRLFPRLLQMLKVLSFIADEVEDNAAPNKDTLAARTLMISAEGHPTMDKATSNDEVFGMF